jgi:3-oxoacyl-[acyl-carrier-protein] synthase I
MTPLLLKDFTATSCIGRGLVQTTAALEAHHSGLAPCKFDTVDIDTYLGEVPGVDEESLDPALRRFDCRNNRLAQLALRQDDFREAVHALIGRWGRRRIGVFIGTSTSGILQTELAYRNRDPKSGALPADFLYGPTHNSFSIADFVRQSLQLAGPAVAISCACASGAKAFGSAQRAIQAGLIDAALVGGVDSLCLTTLYGFHSLQLTSPARCRPFDVARDGISIGEAAAFAILEPLPDSVDADAVTLLAVGESSDAHHMSAPHPQGLGARLAMQEALRIADLHPSQIDYINLHGTGTVGNDRAESHAVTDVFGPFTPCSSTKGATGHTLGAAGALEAVIGALALRRQMMPGGLNTTQTDSALKARYLRHNQRSALRHVLSNSFGFGGVNCSLILGTAT